MDSYKFYDKYGIFIEVRDVRSPGIFHLHEAYEIYYLLSGARDYFIEDAFFKVNPGEFALVPINALHKTGGKGGTRFLIYFTKDALKKYFTDTACDFLTHGISRLHVKPCEDDLDRVIPLFTALIKYREEEKPDKFFIYLAELLTVIQDSVIVDGDVGATANLVKKVTEYVSKNFSTVKGVEELSEKFFVNKSYLCRAFKKTTGVHFSVYLNKIRLKKAGELLSLADKRVSQVAEECGFNSTAYFCNLFKKEYGITPLDFRNGTSIKKEIPFIVSD